MIYYLGGTILPVIVSTILAAATQSLDTFKIVRKIFYCDPFWNFKDALEYNFLSNFIKGISDPDVRRNFQEGIDKIYQCGPYMAMAINSGLGIIFFVLAVILDRRLQGAFKRSDGRQPRWYPKYLD
jgi:hypothetical protein